MPHYSLAPFIQARPWLRKMITPIAQWYGNASGYRQLGLRYAAHLEGPQLDQLGASPGRIHGC